MGADAMLRVVGVAEALAGLSDGAAEVIGKELAVAMAGLNAPLADVADEVLLAGHARAACFAFDSPEVFVQAAPRDVLRPLLVAPLADLTLKAPRVSQGFAGTVALAWAAVRVFLTGKPRSAVVGVLAAPASQNAITVACDAGGPEGAVGV